MSDIAIRVENLSKQYRIGGPQARYKTIRESLTEAVQVPFRRLSSVLRGQSSAIANETIWALKDVSFEVKHGEVAGIIGRSGAGKTSLLKVLSGLLSPKRGNVCLDGTDLQCLSRRQIARCIAVVPQELTTPFAFSAWEMVMLGRTPHVRPLVGAGPHDREVVQEKMALTGTLELASRPFIELSGGEQQRVIIAMALAQEAEILLLDEPTVHLDISHQVEILELIKRLNRQQGLTVLAIIHDLNLAALYFDRLVLLNGGWFNYDLK